MPEWYSLAEPGPDDPRPGTRVWWYEPGKPPKMRLNGVVRETHGDSLLVDFGKFGPREVPTRECTATTTIVIYD
jgi:hypothetical protein